MSQKHYNLLLADDDFDDCDFFRDALDDLPISTELTTVHDGVALMKLLIPPPTSPPDALFLDLNMPRMTGFDCLSELKLSEAGKYLPIIIFSTYLHPEVVNKLYDKGAHFCIRKPGSFVDLKKIIFEALTLLDQTKHTQPERDKFILHL